jgi:hypothetical protein
MRVSTCAADTIRKPMSNRTTASMLAFPRRVYFRPEVRTGPGRSIRAGRSCAGGDGVMGQGGSDLGCREQR